MKGILKSRPVTPEVIVDNVNIVEKSRVVADKALNLLNPYRQVFSGIQDRSIIGRIHYSKYTNTRFLHLV